MRANGLREAWAEGRAARGGWLTIPSGFSAEIMAHAGFDWVCVDMQHGVIDYQQMVAMLQAVSSTAVTPLVRVPWNEPGIIGKTLDAGARGVIVPMVNSRAEAERAVWACRYAPEGGRSYGPLRANYYAGFDYYEHANDDVLCIVMIETRDAVARVDEILSVAGIDAVYVGPADLSITLGLAPGPDHDDASFTDALALILDACRTHGVVPGIAGNQKTAPKRIEQGFRLVEVASDARLLGIGAGDALNAVTPGGSSTSKSAYL
ncbi:MAG: 4-hydroxy-2-oxoheptanedioate aldolase [Actinomycetota bacterium]|nr:4-hydroxy-2-oxoheptanedioate aldolase [Actinomycetota bacterium]